MAAGCSRRESQWQETRREDTAAAYQRYLEEFPVGAHARDAAARLAGIREAEDWARAERLRTPEAWQRYLGTWPDGPHAALALERLVDFVPPPAAASVAEGLEIQLGAWSSESSARAGLERLERERPALVAALELRVTPPSAGSEALWRLRAGPFPEADARGRCATLLADGVSCFPVLADSAAQASP
jgi:SPOR domain